MTDDEHERFLAKVGPGEPDRWTLSTYYGRATPAAHALEADVRL
jgi:hypothetical protein